MVKQFNLPVTNVVKIRNSDKPRSKLVMPSELRIRLNKKSGSNTHLNFNASMFDDSCKEVVIASWHTIYRRERLKKGSGTSVCRFKGMKCFISFIVGYSVYLGKPITLNDIDKELLESWGGYIRTQGLVIGIVSQIKSLLYEFEELGYLKHGIVQDHYPTKTHRDIHKNTTPHQPLSKKVNKQLTLALRKELIRLHQKEGTLSSYDLTIICLVIAQANGVNTISLLEAKINCLLDHPFDPNKKVLILNKRRGGSIPVQPNEYSKEADLLSPIGLNIVPIIRLVLARNKPIRELLNAEYSTYLFAYDGKHGYSVLSLFSLDQNIKKFVSFYGIKGFNGEPLKLNLSRLRATYLANIFELSGYDTVLTAKYGKHDVRTANQHYRQATPEARQNFTKSVAEIVKELSTGVPTTTASCSDKLYGEKNKHKGKPCMELLACFRCKNMVVAKHDLIKLLSMKQAIYKDRDTWHEGKKSWKQRFRDVLKIIDEIIAKYQSKYPDETSEIEQLKEIVKTKPHPAWINLNIVRQQIAANRHLKSISVGER
jgi:hypothetical protein